MPTDRNTEKHGLLYEDLSYRIIGCAFKVRKKYGTGHKESLYQEAFELELKNEGLLIEREPAVRVIDPETGKPLKSLYRPDFIIENKIIIETKAQLKTPRYLIDQLYDYLRNSTYELGFLINFAEIPFKPVRVIYTNDRKRPIPC